MVILWFIIAHHALSLFTQSFFCHRYSAHRQFTMSKNAEKFFYILCLLFQGSSFLSPYAYGVMHRMHHAWADTFRDPHSPKYSKNIFTMMWRTWIIFQRISKRKMVIPEKFTKNVPYWKLAEDFGNSSSYRISWTAFYIVFYAIFATHWWMFLCIPIHIFINPIHGAIINWYAHKYGDQKYTEMTNTSRNFWDILAFLMLGEGYHNSHHYDAKGVRFGLLDPVYPFILFFDLIGVIHLPK